LGVEKGFNTLRRINMKFIKTVMARTNSEKNMLKASVLKLKELQMKKFYRI